MEYHQQRRSRNVSYNNGRQMNYNRQMNGDQRQAGCDQCARQMERDTCGCNRACTYQRQKGCLEESEYYPVGMGYIPWQSWKCTYDAHRGLMSGTIFPELDKPFCAAGRCMR